ncbi:MAG TPA: RNA polymerase sigma factor [Anaerolineales bacterium]|nr:RNA polymerase sigma factor [Anaerolineales bacterium]
MNEKELIHLAQSGDLFAFNELVSTYERLVYNVCFRVLSNRQDAEDLTQETFITAFQKIGQYRGDSFKSWLLRIATNRSIDLIRSRQHSVEVPLEPESVDGEENRNMDWMIDPKADIEQIMDQSNLSSVLRRCIEKLGMDQRVVIVLIDVFEMGYVEVTEVVKKPLGTIKSRLVRARNQVRDCVDRSLEHFMTTDRHKGEA